LDLPLRKSLRKIPETIGDAGSERKGLQFKVGNAGQNECIRFGKRNFGERMVSHPFDKVHQFIHKRLPQESFRP
jgi:hypothetical protein